MNILSDTAPDVERVMYEAYRRMNPARKWKNLREDYRMARALHAAGMRHRCPIVSLQEIQANWIETLLGQPCPVPIPESLMEPIDQEHQPVLRFALQTLDRLGIAYAIGDSVASSLHGAGRMTRDADVTVEPFAGREDVFIAAFPAPEFYLNVDTVREAVRARSGFNILHPATAYKIDIFVRKDEPFEQAAFARRGPYPMPGVTDELVQVHSPEDIVLFKLRWYRLGGEISDRQWGDILGVLKTQGAHIDNSYLGQWATVIGVKDLLDRIRGQV